MPLLGESMQRKSLLQEDEIVEQAEILMNRETDRQAHG